MRITAICSLAALAPVALALPLTTSAAAAEPPPPAHGFQGGLRFGYARPIGGLQSQAALRLTSLVDSERPLMLDLGWRLGTNWLLGAYGSIAGGEPGSAYETACIPANCSVTSYRFGVQGLVFILPDERLDPWLGVAIGYDFTRLKIDGAGGAVSIGVRGWEAPRLLGGVDYRFSRYFAFGPYLDFAVGEYTDSTVSTPRYATKRSISDAEAHAWFSAGLRWVVFP